MLQNLAERDKEWQLIAYGLCKDYDTANDIVQDAYIKIHEQNKTWDDIKNNVSGYVYFVIRSIFIDYCRKKKTVPLNGYKLTEADAEPFEPTDEQLFLLQRYNNLCNVSDPKKAREGKNQQMLLVEIYDTSLRQIEKEYPLGNYGYVFRQIRSARATILKGYSHKFKNKEK